MIQKIFVIKLLVFFQLSLLSQGADVITGCWLTPENEAIVQIEKTGGHYTGKILRIHPGGYINGSAPMDENNEDLHLRSRSLEGITILSGISYDSKRERWQVNMMYDPDRGKFFIGYIELHGPDRLKVRGHIPGKKWLGETEIWKRQEDFDPTENQKF